MRRFREAGAALLLLLSIVGSAGCETEDPGFPSTGTVRAQLFDSGLTFQTVQPKGFQVATWVVESAMLRLDGFDEFDFLGIKPCVFTDNVILADDLAGTCRGTGLVLEAEQPVEGILEIVISSMTLRIGEQPTLSAEADFDGDEFINRYDNCPLIVNPAQGDINGDGVGDACSIIDPSTGELSLRDSDRDGFPDGIDNCQLVPNADQKDSVRGRDFIGDTCERFSNVVLPGALLTLTFPVQFTPMSSRFTVLIVDFNSRIAVRCDAERTSCKIEPGAVGVTISSV